MNLHNNLTLQVRVGLKLINYQINLLLRNKLINYLTIIKPTLHKQTPLLPGTSS